MRLFEVSVKFNSQEMIIFFLSFSQDFFFCYRIDDNGVYKKAQVDDSTSEDL